MVILVVNNYADKGDSRAEGVKKVFVKNGKPEVVMWHFSEIRRDVPKTLEGIVLSGSAAHLKGRTTAPEYEAETDLIMNSTVPILGICFGHQLIGQLFGSDIASFEKQDEFESIKILEPDEIMKSWKAGDTIRLQESHEDFVVNIPERFICLAESAICRVEAMKHETKPIYGIQAHVERATEEEPDGHQIIRNFLKHVVDKPRDTR